jgi:hypothetical protein
MPTSIFEILRVKAVDLMKIKEEHLVSVSESKY